MDLDTNRFLTNGVDQSYKTRHLPIPRPATLGHGLPEILGGHCMGLSNSMMSERLAPPAPSFVPF